MKEDLEPMIEAEQLRTVLDLASRHATTRGLGAGERGELIAMLTPDPKHIAAA